MKVVDHTAISIVTGGLLYYWTRSLHGLFWFLAAGIFIDLDHYLDYAREYGFSFNFRKVYHTCKYGHTYFKNLTLILHSYELVAILWLAIFLFDLNISWKAAAIGLTLHIIMDQAANPLKPLAYFLWFRIANNFETEKMYKKKGVLC
ncbi:MAG: hypothetical protein ABH815_02775 [Candidatus Omnitrophota bacterium]